MTDTELHVILTSNIQGYYHRYGNWGSQNWGNLSRVTQLVRGGARITAQSTHFPEKEMATHSSILAWRIPGTEEPGGLPYGVTQSRTQLKRLSSSSKENFHFPCPGFKTLHLQNEVATNWPLHNKDIMQPQANSCWGCQLHMTSHEIQMLLYRFCYFPQCFTPVCHPPVLCKDVSIPSLR